MSKAQNVETVANIKKFMKEHKNHISCSFTMTKKEYNEIAVSIANNFTEFRVNVRPSALMPAQYRARKEVKVWVELTISK